MHPRAEHFDAMYAGGDADPWHYRTRWYEARKRALTLACLPEPRYEHGYEPGCANGELSAALALRCDRLLISDGSEAALDAARERTRGMPNIELRRAWLPDDLPDQSFDLIVISEWAYYLGSDDLDVLGDCIAASLRPGGTLLACHWRRPIEGCLFDGFEVNRRLGKRLGGSSLTRVDDADFRLDVWSRDGRSVAQREGFA